MDRCRNRGRLTEAVAAILVLRIFHLGEDNVQLELRSIL